MTGRQEHVFQFAAHQIADAARTEAEYHSQRLGYWREEYDNAATRVEETIGAKIVRHPVTGGQKIQVVVDYGDQAAYARMVEAWNKIERHEEYVNSYTADATVYGSQGERVYELTRSDVRWFRLGGEARTEEAVEQLQYA